MDDIGHKIEKYRKEKNLTQKDMANLLGVTQVHVSRIEKEKVNISKRLLARIISIIGEYGEGFGFELETASDNVWNYATFTYGNNSSGDRVRINSKRYKDKTVVMHCDASGSDVIAAKMADNLVIIFESTLAAFTSLTCTPEAIYSSMDEAYRYTGEFWRGDTSLNIISLSKQRSTVHLLNAGMPNLYLYKNGKSALARLPEIKWPPLGGLTKGSYPYADIVTLERGDTFCSFSDGFIEQFEMNSSLNLDKYLHSLCHAMRGDCEGIGLKILKELEKGLKGKSLDDNMSFFMVSKKQE